MSPSARQVVAEYLAAKNAKTKPEREREAARSATEQIIDELPDGFTAKDVRACVTAFAEFDADLADMGAGRRTRVVTKTLDGMVADGYLKLEADQYAHAIPTP